MLKKIFSIFCLVCILALNLMATEPLLRFAWLSDTHIGSESADEDLALAVKDINTLGNIDFVIVSGDITEMDVGCNMEIAKRILDSLQMEYYIIPGNHDTKWSASACAKFPALWGSDRFTFERAGFRFIGLHQGPLLRMGYGYFAPEDLRWLSGLLEQLENPDQPLIFITHYPVDNSVSNWFEFLDKIKKYDTQVILHGHGHANLAATYEGVPGVMGRSTLKTRTKPGGFNIVTLYPDSLVFQERITGRETLPVWHRLRLGKRGYIDDSAYYARPDYGINTVYPRVIEHWQCNTGYAIAAPPAVGKDLVVTVNSGGIVQALQLETGAERWRFRAGRAIFAAPALAADRVVVAAADSFIYCLAERDGQLLWNYKTNAGLVAVPVIEQEVVYIGASDGCFRALDLITGKLNWRFDGVTGFVECKPLLYQNKVIFGAWDNCLYALNQRTGALCWKWQDGTPGELFSPAAVWPVATHGKVFIAAPDRYLSCVEAESGQTLWRSNRFKVRETVGISEDGETIFARCMEDTVIAISARSDSLQRVWAQPGGYEYDIDPSMPVEKDGMLFYGDKDGILYALEAATGTLIWKHRLGVGLMNTVVPLDHNRVVATVMDGKVALIENQED